MPQPEVASQGVVSAMPAALSRHVTTADWHPLSFLFAGSDISLLRVVAALILCLALGVTTIVLLRNGRLRAFPHRSNHVRRLRAVETLRLNTRTTLYLVELDGSAVLLACDPAGVSMMPWTAQTAGAKQ